MFCNYFDPGGAADVAQHNSNKPSVTSIKSFHDRGYANSNPMRDATSLNPQ